jgi:Branched-chain polyamine synthase A C-terminal domain
VNYQVTRHLSVKPDKPRGDKTLLHNLYLGTRMLAGPEIWPLLEKFREPSPLVGDPLEERAVQAAILAPVDEVMKPNDLVSRFDKVSAKVLKYRKTEPNDDLFLRLDQLLQVCRPLSNRAPSDYFIWQDPGRVFAILLEHFRRFLELEVGTAQTGPISSEFVQKSLGRPPCVQTLEQQTCTLHTSWKRAAEVTSRFPSEAKILILGDDDLVSLALAQYPGYQLDVLELDMPLVRLLKKEGGGYLKVLRRDLSGGLPDEFHDQYDVVLSDPMYAAEGMEMFLACCVKALKPTPESRLFLSTYPPLLEDVEGFHGLLEAYNLKVEKTTEHYNRYPFPEDSRTTSAKGLVALGFHPKLVQILAQVPYLYAHLFECRRVLP